MPIWLSTSIWIISQKIDFYRMIYIWLLISITFTFHWYLYNIYICKFTLDVTSSMKSFFHLLIAVSQNILILGVSFLCDYWLQSNNLFNDVHINIVFKFLIFIWVDSTLVCKIHMSPNKNCNTIFPFSPRPKLSKNV